MDLTPLYELRERLKAGAVAGTGLLGEDFRLVRALEGLAPLEGASPVFQKIGQGVRVLLDPGCPDRPAALLDALSLCDAVLTTQGMVGAAGPLEPLPATSQGSAMTNAPYSVLSPLMEALTSSGGGRYALIVDTHAQRPELFRDYRVKNALVAALGAAYSELADRAEEWLCAEGADIVPLLKQGFDPKGKREMVRRIHVMERAAGAGENAFYLSLLEESEKEVRAAAVYALRHHEGNAERLAALCKTEKGGAKKAAHWALAQLRSPAAWVYWDALAAKKPEQVADYMVLSTAPKAGELIGEALCALLASCTQGKESWNAQAAKQLRTLLYALPGKAGPAVCDFYRRGAALGGTLDVAPEGEKEPARFSVGASGYGRELELFSAILPALLRHSLVLNPSPDLTTLAGELLAAYGGLWAGPALMAILLTREAYAALEEAKPLVIPAFRLFGGKEDKAKAAAAAHALEALHWEETQKRHLFSLTFWEPMEERHVVQHRALPARLDSGWFAALASRGTEFDDTLIRLMDPEDMETGQMLAKHFHDSALVVGENRKYLAPLKQLGWTDFCGLLTRSCKGQKHLNYWRLRQYVEELPLSNAEKAGELEVVLRDAEAGKIGFQGGRGIQDLRTFISDLKAAPAANQ